MCARNGETHGLSAKVRVGRGLDEKHAFRQGFLINAKTVRRRRAGRVYWGKGKEKCLRENMDVGSLSR